VWLLVQVALLLMAAEQLFSRQKACSNGMASLLPLLMSL
jgi:hypothetical protein